MSDPDRPHPHAAFLEGLRHARRFQDRPVPPAIIDDLLAAGHGQDDPATPAWQFLVVDDRETRQALSRIGAFTSTLADAAVAIVIVSAARSAPSKANEEARAGDRIMLAASRHGLGSGMGWFGTEEAQERVRDILGVPPGRTVWGAVGVGYVDEAPVAGDSALDRARRTLDQLAGPPASGRKPPGPADEQE